MKIAIFLLSISIIISGLSGYNRLADKINTINEKVSNLSDYQNNFQDNINEIQREYVSNDNQILKKISNMESKLYNKEKAKAMWIIKKSWFFDSPVIGSNMSLDWNIAKLTIHFGTCDWCVSDVNVNLDTEVITIE